MLRPVLTTRLSMPSPRPVRVRRERLIERLAGWESRRLTLISAPAGFGKTTLVVDWLDEVKARAAWLSISESDDDPVAFFVALLYAIRRIDPACGDGLLAALDGPQPPGPVSTAAELLNELALTETGMVLVLDDLHLIRDPDLWAGLSVLLEHLPATVHVVINTREDPPIPLARMRARAELLELGASDLGFTTDEADTFLRDVMGLTLDSTQINQLQARIEGWAAGLQLAALSLSGSADADSVIESFSGGHRYILDYLRDEVLSALPADLREFLLNTAIPGQITAPLCEALTGRADSADVLARIDESNLFLVSLDDQRECYRYHHLFADMLRGYLAAHDPARVADLHARASDWFASRGMVSEAIRHADEAGDMDRLVALVDVHSRDAVQAGKIQLAFSWFERLPEDVRRAHPRILMNYSWALFLSSRLDRLYPLPDEIASCADTDDVRAELETLRAFMAFDDPDRMEAHIEAAVKFGPGGSSMAGGLIETALGNLRRRQHRAVESYEHSVKAVGLHWAAGNRVAALTSLLDAVLISRMIGAWHRTESLIEHVIHMAESDGAVDEPGMGMAWIGRGIIQRQRGQFHDALESLQLGLEMARSGGYRNAFVGLLVMVQVHGYLGQEAVARLYLKQVIEAFYQQPPFLWPYLRVQVAGLYLLLRDLDEAGRWLADAANRIEDDYPLTMARLALYRFAAGDDAMRAVTADYLAPCVANYKAWGWPLYHAEALALRALLHQQAGDHKAAQGDLRAALTLAQPEDEVMIFLQEGEPMLRLLRTVPDHPYAEIALRRLETQARAGDGPHPPLSHPDLVELLSPREVEVLGLMREGLTYADIAERLIISVNTVRYHVKGLYGKLAVSSRAEAIARARELGFVG